MGKGTEERRAEAERRQHAQEDDVSRRSEEDCRSTASAMGKGQGCPEEIGIRDGWFGMGKFSPTKQHGDCEEIANPSTAFGLAKAQPDLLPSRYCKIKPSCYQN
jgi:hypothetical protein